MIRDFDEDMAVLDKALDAAEMYLRELLQRYEPYEVVAAFETHVIVHLHKELINIKKHGHRNDDPEDVPSI